MEAVSHSSIGEPTGWWTHWPRPLLLATSRRLPWLRSCTVQNVRSSTVRHCWAESHTRPTTTRLWWLGPTGRPPRGSAGTQWTVPGLSRTGLRARSRSRPSRRGRSQKRSSRGNLRSADGASLRGRRLPGSLMPLRCTAGSKKSVRRFMPPPAGFLPLKGCWPLGTECSSAHRWPTPEPGCAL